MADGTKIEWTDATWNIVNGCSVLSPGCTNCYAMKLAGTRLKHVDSRKGLTIDTKAGPVWNGTTKFNDKVLLDPIRWKRPRKIFVCAHGDLFHDSVPDEWIDKVFAVMALAPQHQFQVLTKRSARMRAYVSSRVALQGNIGGCAVGIALEHGKQVFNGITTTYPAKAAEARELVIERVHRILPNVWLGVSVEDQQRADERVADLLATPAAVRWLSCEPLLGLVDIRWALGSRLDIAAGFLGRGQFSPGLETLRRLDWIVAGGENGPRPMHPDWARSLRDQCARAGVPFLFKQWGSFRPAASVEEVGSHPIIANNRRHLPVGDPRRDALAESGLYHMPHQVESKLDGTGQFAHLNCAMVKVGKKAAGRRLDGVEHNGYPS